MALGTGQYYLVAAQTYNLGAGTALEQLDAPTGLIAAPQSATSVQVSYDAVPGAAGYLVRMALNAQMAGSVIIYQGPLRTYLKNGLAGDTDYYFSVAALGDNVTTLTSAPSDAEPAHTPAPPVGQPAAPTGLTVENDGTVTWDLAGGRLPGAYEYYVGATNPAATWLPAPSRPFASGAGIGVLVHLRIAAAGAVPAGLEDAASSGGVHYAQAYIEAVENTGTSLSQSQKDSVYALEDGLKSNGLLSNVSRSAGLLQLLYPLLGGTAAAHAINFINPNLFRMTWYGSPTHTANGVQFNGVNQYGDTGFVSDNLAMDSNHLAFYADAAISDPDRSGQGVMGAGVSAMEGLFLSYNRANITYYSTGGAVVIYQQPQALAGLMLGTRTGTSAAAAYHAGQPVASSATATSGVISSAVLTIGRVNINGQYSAVPCSLTSAGRGLSAGQTAVYNTLIQDFQTANGRAR